ncbi:hypothetical protein D9615_006873 [Tricholomella constricta]|uniref:Peptidase C14 caspase domain-containing protein n=1 Tax=Tricholomella constricta TaxID=117010 RepID=A0A8H5M2T4_9AGAR|nr:hypothetical protein D9615_006873 [Tricholomella constricta]
MKIIKHRLGRRYEYWGEAEERKPQKKALLVGIQYERDEEGDGDEANVLRGPHRDVAEMRDLLIDCYSYLPEDIVVLIDTDEPGQTQPTRDNMVRSESVELYEFRSDFILEQLRAIKALVEDARPGDRFFFHYAGHTVQIENKNFSEEDGMDECIIPSDGEARMIKDNELRRHLVDSLPIGSNLVAIFDSCHSASLLGMSHIAGLPELLLMFSIQDLEHFRCNRPYVPWISKGKRRSDSQLNANVRRHAVVVSRHVYQSKRVNSSSVKSRRTSIDQILISSPDYRELTIRTKALSMKSELEKWYDTPSSPILRCTSPDSMWPCTGYCPPSSPTEANVISVAACKDDQLSWEDSDGASMTKALVNILKSNPHPPLMDLMSNISHELHGFYLRLHSHARSYRRRVREVNKKRAAKGLPPLRVPSDQLPMDNFQDPQMSSHRPVMREIKDFLNDQQRGDQFFFYFAGHSSQVISDDEGEEDGKDEVMLPVDAYKPGGAVDYDQAIFDDYLYKHLIDALKPKCRLTIYRIIGVTEFASSPVFFDVPHEGQFLPEAQRGEGTNKATKMTKYMFTTKERIGLCSGFCLRLKNNRNNVVCISACKDSEETLEGAKYPTMTKALCDLLENEQHPTLKKVMRELTDRIHTTRIHDHSTSQPLPGVSKEGKPQVSYSIHQRVSDVIQGVDFYAFN